MRLTIIAGYKLIFPKYNSFVTMRVLLERFSPKVANQSYSVLFDIKEGHIV